MKKIIIYSFFVFLSIYVISCSSTKEIESIPVEQRYQKAKALFDDESYLEAIDEFKIITVQNQGSEFGDDAQFYLAESRFNRGEYILAAAEYDNLTRTMPNSPYAPLSRYKKGLSNYLLSPKPQLDQKYTRMSIDDFQTYVEYSSKDSMVGDAEKKIEELTTKLAKKIFESGILYYRLEYYKSGIAYFDRVISEYNDRGFTDDAMFWKAKCQNARKDFTGADATLTDLLTKYPETDLKKDIDELRSEIIENQTESLLEQKDKLSVKNE